jgi:hypothetical protein
VLLVPALCPDSAARSDSAWGFVAARNNGRYTEGISLPDSLPASLIRWVRPPGAPPPDTVRRPVIGFDCSRLLGSGRNGGEPGRPETEPEISADALWPDQGNVIAFPGSAAKGRMAEGLRNPWELRTAQKADRLDCVVHCGGVIIGGDGGPAAIANGRLVRRGDHVDRFIVEGILRTGLLLERDGVFLVLPLGRTVTIRMTGP